jgi:hypothetical protein
MRVKVVLNDVGAKENGVKAQVVLKYYSAHPRTRYEEGIYELRNHVGEKALNSNLSPKLGLTKKTLPASFPNHLLKNV